MTDEAKVSRKEFEAFQAIMVALSREGIGDLNDRAQHISRVTNVSWFAQDWELHKILEKTRGDFGERVLPMRPPSGLDNERTIVGMWCSWDFESGTPYCQIVILIWRGKGCVYGFRVDPPHVFDKHRFWHVQFTHRFCKGKNIRFPVSEATWIDDRTPAFPILLGNTGSITPKEATVYAVVSLYGSDISTPIYDRIRELTKKGVHGSLKELIPRPAPVS